MMLQTHFIVLLGYFRVYRSVAILWDLSVIKA